MLLCYFFFFLLLMVYKKRIIVTSLCFFVLFADQIVPLEPPGDLFCMQVLRFA